ncbi:hypothetical protein vseg_015224 [Gypsophila vaccaria]
MFCHVHHICSGNVHFTMTCQDICAVEVICLAVVGVVRVDVLNFALLLRLSAASQILWPPHVLCCRMSSTFRQHRVTTASLVSCSASTKLHVYFLLLHVLWAVKNC